MRNWTTFAVVIGLLLGGFPHAFCNCGCAGGTAESEAGAQRAAPACPHCYPGDSTPTQESPKPCECAKCETVKAALVGSQVNAPFLLTEWRAAIEPANLCVASLAPFASGQSSRTGRPCTALPLGCALPILLESLLL